MAAKECSGTHKAKSSLMTARRGSVVAAKKCSGTHKAKEVSSLMTARRGSVVAAKECSGTHKAKAVSSVKHRDERQWLYLLRYGRSAAVALGEAFLKPFFKPFLKPPVPSASLPLASPASHRLAASLPPAPRRPQPRFLKHETAFGVFNRTGRCPQRSGAGAGGREGNRVLRLPWTSLSPGPYSSIGPIAVGGPNNDDWPAAAAAAAAQGKREHAALLCVFKTGVALRSDRRLNLNVARH